MQRDWDAETYDRIADPQFRWGLAVLDCLDLRGDETVLDADAPRWSAGRAVRGRRQPRDGDSGAGGTHGCPHVRGNKVFASPEETADRLRRAGYADVECWLHEEPTPFDSVEDLAVFLHTVALGTHVASMTPEEADAFASEVARRLPSPELDYVRLNIKATRLR